MVGGKGSSSRSSVRGDVQYFFAGEEKPEGSLIHDGRDCAAQACLVWIVSGAKPGALITGNLRNSESMMGKAIGHSRVNSPTMTISLGASAETIMCIGHG